VPTMNTEDVDCTVQLTVHTFSNNNNSGIQCDTIAGRILEAVRPSPTVVVSADGVQVLSTKLISDETQNYSIQNTRNYCDRVIIFEHNIYLNN
jgi:hypothetical protein